MDYSKQKTSELLDALYSTEGELADSKEEGERIDAIFSELECRVPFIGSKEERKDFIKRLDKIEKAVDRLEYFVRGLQIADIIQKLDGRKQK